MVYCKNCGKKLFDNRTNLCKQCYLKTLQGKNNPAWKGGKPKCIDCGKRLSSYIAKRCVKCRGKSITSKLTKQRFKNPKNHPMYIDGRTNKQYYCKECNSPICMQTANYGTGLCRKCIKKYTISKIIKNRRSYKGNKNPNYRNGLSNKPYPLKFNRVLKLKIFRRDRFTCKKCQVYPCNDLTAHHIDYDKDNCEEKNLITLCRNCNSIVNFNRNYWTKYFRDKLCISKK